jgi:hypothetical protein
VTGQQAPRPRAGHGEVAVAAKPATVIEARDVVKSFGQTPALRREHRRAPG